VARLLQLHEKETWNMIKIISGGIDVLIGTPTKLNDILVLLT
jgi:hypothetical protein